MGARCNNLFSENPIDLNKIEWDKKRLGMLCFSDIGIGEIKKALLKLCELNRCTFAQVQEIKRVAKRLDEIRNPIRQMPWVPPGNHPAEMFE